MTTPRDLLIISMDVTSDHPVEQGELSLALAGGEVLDLVGSGALTLDDERMVPGPPRHLDDSLLREASSSLVREAPYESVEDWLWRRGRGLHAAYVAALEAEGQITWERSRWNPLPTGRRALTDSPARREAAERWRSGEPVLAVLASCLGIRAGSAEDPVGLDDVVVTVLAAVNDAVTELTAVRQRRAIEEAAFDNIWRGY